MKKSKFIFSIILSLLSGFIIGSIVTYSLSVPHKIPGFEKRHAAKLARIVNELSLSEKQKQQFYNIHAKHLTRLFSLMHKSKPAILQILDDENKEIASILSSGQLAKFDEISSSHMSRFKRKFANIELMKQQLPLSESK